MNTDSSSAADERYLRNASIINQDAINAHPVVIVGVGAIGSHLATQLAQLGVREFQLIDPDEVDTVNLAIQGFHEEEVGMGKVVAVQNRIHAINSRAEVYVVEGKYEDKQWTLLDNPAVFACVDCMKVRRRIFMDFMRSSRPALFDGRMAAEALRAFCVTREPESMQAYEQSLFPSREAFREGCTARATIYCASMAAAVLCSLYKRWSMGQFYEPHVQIDLMTFDCIA